MNIFILVLAAVAVIAFVLFQRIGGAPVSVIRSCLRDGGLVIDVRTEREFEGGHHPQAINVPVAVLSAEIAQRVPDKNTPLLLHCASGGRSSFGRRMLLQQGYTRVYNLGSYSQAGKILAEASGDTN